MQSVFNLYDKVKIKSENIIGFIVYIEPNNTYVVESEDNTGKIFYNLTDDEIEKIEQL